MISYLINSKITHAQTGEVLSNIPLIVWQSHKRAEGYVRLLSNPNLKGAESEFIKIEYTITEVPYVSSNSEDEDDASNQS